MIHQSWLYLYSPYLYKQAVPLQNISINSVKIEPEINGLIFTKNFQYGKFHTFSQIKSNKYFKTYYGDYIPQNYSTKNTLYATKL